MADIVIAMPDAARVAELLGALPDGLSVATAGTAAEAAALASDARVLAGMPRIIDQAVIDAAPRLELLQMMTSGVDLIRGFRIPDSVAIATGRGIHGPQLSELAFFYMLGLLRDARAVLGAQAESAWRRRPQPSLYGRHLVIVGVGAISEELAARARAFGMRVTGVSGSRGTAPGFDAIRPIAELKAAAAEADVLVVLAPYSAATHQLISRDVIAALSPRAILINLARGAVVDEDALIEALEKKAIAGAGLDVFVQEPLPADSRLWALDNVLLTPHVGGSSDKVPDLFAPLLRDNILRWREGRDLINRVTL